MSNRPTDAPDWATNPNFAAGASEWNGNPNKLKPSAGKIAEGFDPDEDFFVEWENWILNNHAQWISYLDSSHSGSAFGDGSDGVVILDGTVAAPAWATKSGSVYTMTRDAFLVDLTITGASTRIKTNGFRLYGRGTLTTTAGGKITNIGNAGDSSVTVGLPGAAGNVGTVGGGTAGATGVGVHGGVNGNDATTASNSLGGAGGRGGSDGSTHTGGFGGGAVPPVEYNASVHIYTPHLFGYFVGPGAAAMFAGGIGAFFPIVGGAGGGSGAGAVGGADAGGGGGGGGVLPIAFRNIVLANASDISAAGGAGGGAAGGSGGGGGGGGGVVQLVYVTLSVASGAVDGATCCAGGAGGAGAGGAGIAGSSGSVFLNQLSSTSTVTATPSVTHEEKGYAAVTTGAGLGHEYVDFTWAQPFSAATGASGYEVEGQISLTTDGDPVVGWNVTNKTTTGFRVRFPSGGFNGEFRWSAK